MGLKSRKPPVSNNLRGLSAVDALAAKLDEYDLAEISWESSTLSISMRKAGASAVSPGMALAPQGVAAPAADVVSGPAKKADDAHTIKSPFVGTFYRRPNPKSDPYVEVGARVSEGSTLCIVEAMKLMNEIESDRAGVIEEILVADGDHVEFGQPLFVVGD